jgi:pSer/pThr/pTyr-binding forkhead associated (FHA) protein
MTHDSLELFRKSCGMTGDLELRIARKGVSSVRRHLFRQPFVLVGSHPANDLVIQDPAINARHAYLQVIQGSLFCLDLGSQTGLRWGQRVQPYGWLVPGRSLYAGPYLLWLAESAQNAEPVSDQRVPLDPLREELLQDPSRPCFMLELHQESGQMLRVRGTRLLTLIGRSSTCTLRLEHPSVSGYHCSVLNTPQGPCVLDLLSREGILVNGKRRRWACLKDGDELRVGKYALRLHYEVPAVPSTGSEAEQRMAQPATEARGVMTLLPGQDQASHELDTRASPVPVLTRLAEEQSLLLPVIQQFNLMQQQMFDQFHQSMMMLVEMFSAMHREQAEWIRVELERLGNLTQELRTLQAELKKLSPTIGPEFPGAPVIRSFSTATDGNHKDVNEEKSDEDRAATATNHPMPAATPPSSGDREKLPSLQGAGAGNDIHAWLSRRIDELQRERQTRWQKVMQFMLGK